jgi:hypothetical protein
MTAVLAAGHNVIQSQVLGFLAAVLTRKAVTQKDLFLGQLSRQEGFFYHVVQADH